MSSSKCPVLHSGSGTSNKDWWPNQLDVSILAVNNNENNNNNTSLLSSNTSLLSSSSPLPRDFEYGKEFLKLDLDQVKADLKQLLTDSQSWWPADYGHYGPLLIRMAWHSAGTYRISDGRGGGGSGQQRFAPLNSWPDNGNLDKARRLLWPVKQKYGAALSWADLMILAGNVALEDMGFTPFGFAGGRVDVWEPEDYVNWGMETEWLTANEKRYPHQQARNALANPLGAVEMGLIYVNPAGPNGVPDPIQSAKDIRETFGRMAMNDEETVALVAGGHSFGKCHGAVDPNNLGREPEAAPLEQMGLGWQNQLGVTPDKITTSGFEGAWTKNPTQWDANGYLDNLFDYDWELTKSPAGQPQWKPKGRTAEGSVPTAHDARQFTRPMMTTADMALKYDPIYKSICQRFRQNPHEFANAFAKAWYKLTHRDMGPHCRCLGPDVPPPQIWQDPTPPVSHPLINAKQAEALKRRILSIASITPSQWVETAWASASTYRNSDKRGGANGARIRLAPQRHWKVNKPDELERILKALESVQREFHAEQLSKGLRTRVSLADLIVLAGCAGVEAAARSAGHDTVTVPFTPGRTDATPEMTDAASFDVLEPTADGFRNYLDTSRHNPETAERVWIDRSQLLGLTTPEVVVLLGGLRVLAVGDKETGVLTQRPGVLTTDYFVHLLDMGTEWKPVVGNPNLYQGTNRSTGRPQWKASRVDLSVGSHSVLRALAEVYGSQDAGEHFVSSFVAAFVKVMEADRWDLRTPKLDAAAVSKL